LKGDKGFPKIPFLFLSPRPRAIFLYHQITFNQTEFLSLFLPLKTQIQSDVEYIQMEFKLLRELLDSKENEKLQELKKEKEDVVKRLERSENELVQRRQRVRDLISYMQHQLKFSTMDMQQVRLQEVLGSRC